MRDVSGMNFEALKRAAVPVAEFLRENGNPYWTAVITSDRVRVVIDEIGIPLSDPVIRVPFVESREGGT
jgi:hypothetical protein